MNLETLQQFCAGEGDIRYYLRAPFNQGAHTYATNGHIAIRVPRMEGFEEREEQKIKMLFATAPKLQLVSLPEIPPVTMKVCSWCDGSGKYHVDRPYKCDVCRGSGQEEDVISVPIGAAVVANKCAAMIASLPNAKIGIPQDATSPITFTFDGGEGLVMGMRRG